MPVSVPILSQFPAILPVLQSNGLYVHYKVPLEREASAKTETAVTLLREHNPTAVIVTTPWDQLTGAQLLEAIERKDTLAQALELEPAVVAQAVQVTLPPLSLTADEEGQADLPVASYEEELTDRLALQQVLDTLPPRDRALIRLRYLGHQTQQATADRLGMTQVQVSRRERAVLIELRQKLSV